MTCSRCVLDSTVPRLDLDERGVCRYCRIHDEMCQAHPLPGDMARAQTADAIRAAGKGKDFDCIIGLSGGCDSSYLLYMAVKLLGLRPVAVSFDNGWDTPIAKSNQEAMVRALGVPHKVYGMDPEEYNAIIRAFLSAGVQDADIANDIAITRVLYQAADDFGVDYILDGHCFRTEGIAPLGWTYMDGQYIKSVCAAHGVDLRTFPNLPLDYWLPRIHRHRPRLLYDFDYRKEDVKAFLAETFGWQWYGAHHAENVYTKWVSSVLLPAKFGIDKRKIEAAALVRSGQMSREAALAELAAPVGCDVRLTLEVMDRLGLSAGELRAILDRAPASRDRFPTYQPYFRAHRAEFEGMARAGQLPWSFVRKYCVGV